MSDPLICFISRYNDHLKNANKVGRRKGVSTGLGVGLTSFFLFFIQAVGFWFGAYLIQYQDAALGDIFIVSHCMKCTMLCTCVTLCVCMYVCMYVLMYVRMHACMHTYIYVCIYTLYVCMSV